MKLMNARLLILMTNDLINSLLRFELPQQTHQEMDFSSSSGGAGKGLGANERAALMSNLKQQLEIARATEMLQLISEKCFKMCIAKPGSSLSSSDQVSRPVKPLAT